MPAAPRSPLLHRIRAATQMLSQRSEPGAALFNSFSGRYSDNPRAVFEELSSRVPQLRATWTAQAGTPLPAGVEGVELRTAPYASALGHASLLVSNEAVPHLLKKRDQLYVQTWHGSMLKRIGYDNPRYAEDRGGLRRAARDYRRWDLLVSQSPFCTRTMRQAFHYDGEVLESGYPRNDALLSEEAPAIRASVRAAYGVADGELLVLYAPTFRDGETGRSRLPLDLTLLRDVAGPHVRVLVRLHHRAAAELTEPPDPMWSLATDHPDIRELYLASDVLVTDYSSVMFDYVVTGKPVLLYTYDLARYRDELRGFYFDLTEVAPGPLCTTSEQVAQCLADLSATTAAHRDAYEEFRETYAPWEDGRASARVVDRILQLWEPGS
jgi:CDP-glycerol glycerophosphotransferase